LRRVHSARRRIWASRATRRALCAAQIARWARILIHAFLLPSSVMPDYAIGVDMGGTNLRIAAITSEGQLLEKITLGVKVAMGRDYVIGEMCDAIHRLTDQYRGSGRFVGAGIGVPGIIDVEKGLMRKSA